MGCLLPVHVKDVGQSPGRVLVEKTFPLVTCRLVELSPTIWSERCIVNKIARLAALDKVPLNSPLEHSIPEVKGSREISPPFQNFEGNGSS